MHVLHELRNAQLVVAGQHVAGKVVESAAVLDPGANTSVGRVRFALKRDAKDL